MGAGRPVQQSSLRSGRGAGQIQAGRGQGCHAAGLGASQGQRHTRGWCCSGGGGATSTCGSWTKRTHGWSYARAAAIGSRHSGGSHAGWWTRRTHGCRPRAGPGARLQPLDLRAGNLCPHCAGTPPFHGCAPSPSSPWAPRYAAPSGRPPRRSTPGDGTRSGGWQTGRLPSCWSSGTGSSWGTGLPGVCPPWRLPPPRHIPGYAPPSSPQQFQPPPTSSTAGWAAPTMPLGFSNPSHPSTLVPSGSSSASGLLDDDEEECKICMAAEKSAVCIPCGHVIMCDACAQHCFKSKHVECPLCRQKLEGWFGPTIGQLTLPPETEPYWK